jgi:hypothetical protein
MCWPPYLSTGNGVVRQSVDRDRSRALLPPYVVQCFNC